MALSKEERRKNRKKQFLDFVETLFPDGNIPSEEEIFQKVKEGDTTVKTYFLNKMYTDGVPVDNFLLQDPDTAPLAKKIKSIFQDVGIKQDAPNLIAITSRLSKTLKKGVTLDSSYEEMVKAKPFAEKEIQAYQSMYDKTKKSQTKLPRPIRKGTRKLAEGAVPEGVLKTILTSIKSIPSKEDGGILRDAVITALIGYRGADVGGIQSSFEEASAEYPIRPYYDVDTGTLQAPNIEIGGGKKKKGPEKQLGPFLKSVLDRRYKNAVQGELFPNIGTEDIAEALDNYIYPNLPDSVRSKLIKNPKGFTDIRRIFASAMANDLKKPEIASALIGHKGTSLDADTVMSIFYTDIVDEKAFNNRKDALLEFEKLLAKSLGVTSAQDLAFQMGSPFESNKDFVYPVEDFDGKTTGKTVEIELSQEEIEAKKAKSLASDEAFIATKNLETSQSKVQETQNLLQNQELTVTASENMPKYLEAKEALEIGEQEFKKEKAKQTKSERAEKGRKQLQILFDDSPSADNFSGQNAREGMVEVSTDNIDPQTGKNFTPARVAALTGAGYFFVSSSAQAAELIQDVATETAVEGTAAALLRSAPKAIARTGPFAMSASVLPTSDTNMPEVQSMARQNVEKNYFTDPSMTAKPIYRDDRRLSDTDMFRKSALPTSDIPLKARRLKTKKRDTASLIPDYDQTKLSNILSGGKPDMQAGFVTRPNRSELRDETERQLKSNSFLGAK